MPRDWIMTPLPVSANPRRSQSAPRSFTSSAATTSQSILRSSTAPSPSSKISRSQTSRRWSVRFPFPAQIEDVSPVRAKDLTIQPNPSPPPTSSFKRFSLFGLFTSSSNITAITKVCVEEPAEDPSLSAAGHPKSLPAKRKSNVDASLPSPSQKSPITNGILTSPPDQLMESESDRNVNIDVSPLTLDDKDEIDISKVTAQELPDAPTNLASQELRKSPDEPVLSTEDDEAQGESSHIVAAQIPSEEIYAGEPDQVTFAHRCGDLETVGHGLEMKDDVKDVRVATEFRWRHGGNEVYLTGTFDDWKVSIPMRRDDNIDHEFTAAVLLDRSQRYLFKFVVDGSWHCSGEWVAEPDWRGNWNNVLPVINN